MLKDRIIAILLKIKTYQVSINHYDNEIMEMFIVGVFSIAAMIRFSFDNFLFLQSQSISGLSVFNEVLIPLAGLTVLLQIVTSSLYCALLTSDFDQAGQGFLIKLSSCDPSRIVISFFWAISRYSLIYIAIFIGIVLTLASLTNFDWLRVISLLLGMLLAVISLLVYSKFIDSLIKAKLLLLSVSY